MPVEKGVYCIRTGRIVQEGELFHIPGGETRIERGDDQRTIGSDEPSIGKIEVFLVVAPGGRIVGQQAGSNGVFGRIIPHIGRFCIDN